MTEYVGGAGFFDTPPLRYLGGKWQIAEWIIEQMPRHEHYVEPYCGGAAVFFRKRPSLIETINDLDGNIINFFRVLRDQPDELIAAIHLTPYSREEYDLAYTASDDPLEMARRYYIRSRMGFGGFQRINTGWRRMTKAQGRINLPGEWSRLDGLKAAVERLKMDKLRDFEPGENSITLAELRRLASLYLPVAGT